MVVVKDLQLYDFQQELYGQTLEALRAGDYPAVTMATGGGKTELALAIAQAWPGTAHMTAHRVELARQPAERAAGYGIDAHMAWRQSGSDYMTAAKLYTNTHLKFERAYLAGHLGKAAGQLAIVDEMHHAYCATDAGEEQTINWGKSPRISNFLRRWKADGGALMGLTATLIRLNPYDTFSPIFNRHISGPQTAQLVKSGDLAPPFVWSPRGALSAMRAFLAWTANGELDDDKIPDKARWAMVKLPIEIWQQPRLGQDLTKKQTLFFAQNASVAVKQAQMLRNMGHRTGLLLHDDKYLDNEKTQGIVTKRDAVFAGFKNGNIQCVVNVGIAGEGADFPAAEVVVLGFVSKSITRVRQAVGRALRTSIGKTRAFILDCAANTRDPEVGSILNDIEWSVDARDMRIKGMQILAECVDGCGLDIHPRLEHCPGCGERQGDVCPKCLDFRRSYFVAMHGSQCERCDAEELVQAAQAVSRGDEPITGAVHSGSDVWHRLNDRTGMALDYGAVADALIGGEDAIVIDDDGELIELGERIEIRAGDSAFTGWVVWAGAPAGKRQAVAVIERADYRAWQTAAAIINAAA